MSQSRSEILKNIRSSLEKKGKSPDIGPWRPDHPRPRRSLAESQDLVERFVAEAERVDARVERLAARSDLPGAIRALKERDGLEGPLRVAPVLDGLELDGAAWGRAEPGDAIGLSEAFAAVAETGTLVLVSGPGTPTTLNFLPDTHLVVLAASKILPGYEESWGAIREAFPDGPPRCINWITGPSRTADIEQTLLLGAHGPRNLYVLLIDDT